MRLVLALIAVLMIVAGCAPGHGLPPLPPIASDEYHLGPGDAVRIITFGEDALTGEFRVNDSGYVALPLLGSVRAAGRTPRELESAVGAALKRANLLRNPAVSIEVTAYRPIFVLGEVNRPGEYPYQPGMTVLAAAAVAGGFTYRAIQSYASVMRAGDGESIEGKATRRSLLQPGDVVTIYERRF
jgi:polysaccharide export outer membrane protein